MRRIAIALPLLLLTLSVSCANFTWRGRQSGVTEEQAERGIKDYHTLDAEYETAKFWRSVRQRRDGRVNAFGRDLSRIQDLIDRHFFNYSTTDPYVNYPTQSGLISETGGFLGTFIAR